jgi:hypothetical protein
MFGVLTTLMACARGGGEWFSVGISSVPKEPRLSSARLESAEPGMTGTSSGDQRQVSLSFSSNFSAAAARYRDTPGVASNLER